MSNKSDAELLAKIAAIAGERIKLGCSIYAKTAVERYEKICELLRPYWDEQNEKDE